MAERADVPPPAAGQGGAAVRAEFYLCLARAFLAPTPGMHWALTRQLADDLEDMAGEAAYPIAGIVARFRAAIAGFAEHLDLLRLYAALFLVPPTPVRINAGFYLDGTAMGDSVRAMEACYSHLGVVRSAGFRDTSDHVVVQLEFISLLFCRQAQLCVRPVTAQAFLEAFVCQWVKPFRTDMEQATAALAQPNPYLHLAQMLEQAAGVDVADSRSPPRAGTRGMSLRPWSAT